jgi:hypothetical protein
MAKQESIDFQIIFNASTITESLAANAPVSYNNKPEPTLPTDDELWDLLTRSSGRVAQQIEDQEFIREISGPEPSASLPVFTPKTESSGAELLKIARRICTRTAEIAKRAPERRRRIHAIVEQARLAAPESIRDSDGWDRLAASCERYVATAIMELA